MGVGSLTVVGTGIHFPDHLTAAARAAIADADVVVYVVDNPEAAAWLHAVAAVAEPLRERPIGASSQRLRAYDAMVEHTLAHVRAGRRVCAVFYGHPGMFSYPGDEAVRRARAEGLDARTLPAVSTIDCLFADLAVDPAHEGYQVFDATDFLIHRRPANAASHLVLLQPAMVGDPVYGSYQAPGLSALVDALASVYGHEHEVVVYRAATCTGEAASIVRVALAEVAPRALDRASTLYVPPLHDADADLAMLIRLARARR